MRSILRIAFGALLGAALIATLWSLGWVEAPESVTRRMVLFSALYPVPTRGATLQPIECPLLLPARLYLVCTDACETIWRVVLVRGLSTRLLIDEGRLPPESPALARQRVNAAVAEAGLRLDRASAREMIACYLRLEGFSPELVLPPDGVEAVEQARLGGRETLVALVDRLEEPGAVDRIEVAESGDGFEGTMLYWDTAGQGNPILRLTIRLAGNGEVRAVSATPFE